MKTAHLLLGAGGAAVAAALLANRKADQTKDAVLAAVAEENPQAKQAEAEAQAAQVDADKAKQAAASASTPQAAQGAAQQAEQSAAKVDKAAEDVKAAAKDAPPEVKAQVDSAAKQAEDAKKAAKDAADAAAKAKTAEEAKAASAKVAAAAEQTKQATQAIKVATDKVQANAAIDLRLTGYSPYEAAEKKTGQKMEGGIFDRTMPDKYKNDPSSAQYKAHVLHTVEDFLEGKAEFVSLSGDDGAWPYGQLVLIPWFGGKVLKGRVVDTGGHFRGVGKVYRAMGSEPIDVCVASSKTKVPEKVRATIVRGDHFDKKGKRIAVAKFQGQQVQVGSGLDLLGCYT